MKGLVTLLGSGEYLPVMTPVDRYLLDSLGLQDRPPRVVCLPTAAGQEGDKSIRHWSDLGVAHFRELGAEVKALRIIDRDSAEDPQFTADLEQADLIYFSGGNPVYLHQTLHGSRAWNAASRAWERGAIYAGCSAGAMILAQEMPDIRAAGLRSLGAFGSVPARMIFPHFDRWRGWQGWMLGMVQKKLSASEFIFGIDEDTALVGPAAGPWQVMGRQTVSVITRSETQVFRNGEEIRLP